MKIIFIFLLSLWGTSTLIAQTEIETAILALQEESTELYYAGQYEKALEVAQQSVEQCNKANKRDSLYIESMLLVADIANHNQAFDLAKKTLEALEPACIELYGKESQTYADVLSSRGTLYFQQGDDETAISFYLKAVHIYRALDHVDPFLLNDILNSIGNTYDKIGRPNQAETYLREAIDIGEKAFGKNDYAYAVPLTNLAGALAKTPSKWVEAEQSYLEALEVWEALSGKLHPNYAITVGNVGALYIRSEQWKKAEKYMLESLELKAKIIGTNHLDYRIDLSKLAQVYFGQNKMQKSVDVLTDLVAQTKALDGVENKFYLASLNRLTSSRLELNPNDSIARDAILQSLQINLQLPQKPALNAELIDLTEDPTFILDEMAFGETQKILYRVFSNNQPEMAFQFSYNNVRFYSQEKNQTLQEGDRLAFLKETADAAEASLSAIYKTIQKKESNHDELLNLAFELSEYNKSMLLQTVIRSKDAASFGNLPDSLVQKERFYKEELTYIKSLLLGPHSKNEKGNILKEYNSLLLEQENFIQKLAHEYPAYHQLKYQFKAASIAQIQEKLKPNEAFLEYVVGRQHGTFLFYISKNKTQLFHLSQNVKKLNPYVRDLYTALSNYKFISNKTNEAKQLLTKTAHYFYKELLSDALALEENIDHLIIVADGTLGLLPFEVFLTAPSQEGTFNDYPYLLKDYSIGYHYSGTIWSQSSENATSKAASMLAMAASYPSIAKDKQMSTNGMTAFQKLRLSLNDLPAAKAEVKSLETIFEGAFYVGKEASENKFKAVAGDYAVIHLAMHGILDARKPLLSSMAFSEDNKNKEDNFLQAWEISQLKLNANLVVLSACETGFGKFEQGEGILSLARSFMYAGVPSLVVSLWQVNDFATSEIMKNFYNNLSDGMHKAEALRQAKLNFLKNSSGLAAHPAFWSPFIQIGDNSPIQIVKKGHRTPWYIAGSLFLLLAILTFVFVKRRAAQNT